MSVQNNSQSGPKIIVCGSANADIFITSDNIPRVGETVGGELTKVGPGGKGSNSAAAAHLAASSPSTVRLITSIGRDQHATMFKDAYNNIGIGTQIFENDEPTGQAYILLEKNSSHNSIIVCPGANMIFPPQLQLNSISDLNNDRKCILERLNEYNDIKSSLLSIRALLLQREIPDNVNLFFAYTCQHINQYFNFDKNVCTCCDDKNTDNDNNNDNNNQKRIETMLDVGGIGAIVDPNILPYIDLISFNETEMGRVYTQAHQYFEKNNQADNSDSDVAKLLKLDNIVDSKSGGVYLHDLSHSVDNSQIAVLNDYSIFSNNKAISPSSPLKVTNLDLSSKIKVPFDISAFIHAGNAINGMSRTVDSKKCPIAAKMNPIKVLITLGEHGSLLLSHNTILHYQAPMKLEKHEIVDSTGCGDAYRGVFAVAYVEQLDSDDKTTDWSYCMRFATAGATVCLSTLGTLPAMGKREQIEALLPRVPQ